MDKEARRNGLIGSGHGRKNIGLSNIDGGHIPSIDDIGTQKSDDDLVDHGKMSTWGKKTKEEITRFETVLKLCSMRSIEYSIFYIFRIGCSTGRTSHAANIYIPFMGILLQKEMFVSK